MDDGAIKAEIIVEGKCLEIGEGYFKLVYTWFKLDEMCQVGIYLVGICQVGIYLVGICQVGIYIVCQVWDV